MQQHVIDNTNQDSQSKAQQSIPPPLTLHPFVLYALVGIVALLLHVLDLGKFVTIDEAKFWIPRSDAFLRALQSGDFTGIPVVGHPGVTTMWLGSAGIALRRFLFEQAILTQETYPVLLTLHRLPIVLVHTVGMIFGYFMLRRMFPALLAFLAILLWATDPFVIAFNRVLHVDGLAGTFATLSILAACIHWHHTKQLRWLILSGICAGLGILSKLPAMVVGPVVVAMALAAQFTHLGKKDSPQRPEDRVSGQENKREGESDVQHRTLQTSDTSRYSQLAHSKDEDDANDKSAQITPSLFLPIHQPFMLQLLGWGILVFVTIAAAWPLFWTNPLQVWDAFRYGVVSEGGQPHMWGNFFLGQAVEEPGMLFYPVALALRTTPFSLIGLALIAMAMIFSPQTFHAITWRNLATLAGTIVLFVIGMSLFPKKMNRYLVPIFPILDIVAAAGIYWGIMHVQRITANLWQYRSSEVKRSFAPLLVTGIAIGTLINAWWWHPYGVASFNQLLGGARMGAKSFLAGWGEGFDEVASWLNQQPDIRSVVTVTNLRSVLQPYLDEGVYATSEEQDALPSGAGYVVVYLSQVQRDMPLVYRQFYEQAVPLHTVWLQGVPYAWIYHAPQPMDYPLHARFGERLHMQGYDFDDSALRSTNTLTLTLQWYTSAPLPEDYNLFVHVLDSDGNKVSQLDVPLLDQYHPAHNEAVATSGWQPGRYVIWSHPIPLPSHIETSAFTASSSAQSRYWVALGVYRPQDFSRLPLDATVPPDAPDDGEHVLFLDVLDVGY